MKKLVNLNPGSILLLYLAFIISALLLVMVLGYSREFILFILFFGILVLFIFFLLFYLYAKIINHINNLDNKINDNITTGFIQSETLHYLSSFISPKYPLPNTRGWAASPDFIAIIFKNIILKQPTTIVELGSGVSTLFIGHLLKDNHFTGKLLSIDHSQEYAAQTRDNVTNSGLDDIVKVYYCPIKKTTINGSDWLWYDINELKIPGIDMLIVDGPVWSLQNKSRYPAIPILLNNLVDGALIILDDYRRKDEKEIVQDWIRENSCLTLISEIDTEKGTAIIQKNLVDKK